MQTALLICHIRAARRKARAAAQTEALCLLRRCDARAPLGGPLAEQKAVFWIEIPYPQLDTATALLPRLGYTDAVDLVEERPALRQSSARIRWRKRMYDLARLYEEDRMALRETAVDRRTFLLAGPDGALRQVRGYRGNSASLSRRGLPTCDARLLVNLVTPDFGTVFLDPFAGAGGIVIEAVRSGYEVMSCDIDPRLRYGLEALAHRHYVCDAGRLPLADRSVDAIASEPPYDPQAEAAVLRALAELRRVLRPGGRLALLCAASQAGGLRREAEQLGFAPYLDQAIDRKGTHCVALAWQSPT